MAALHADMRLLTGSTGVKTMVVVAYRNSPLPGVLLAMHASDWAGASAERIRRMALERGGAGLRTEDNQVGWPGCRSVGRPVGQLHGTAAANGWPGWVAG